MVDVKNVCSACLNYLRDCICSGFPLENNLAIYAKVFPNSWDAYQMLEWQSSDVREFLESWLVDQWEELTTEEFENLSTTELLTIHEWKIFGECRGCGLVDERTARNASGLFQCDECDLAK